MKNHGQLLREMMKSKGFDIKRLANTLKVSRVSIEKDFAKEQITRRSLAKYLGVLIENFESFYSEKVSYAEKPVTKTNKNLNQNANELTELQAKFIDLQAKYIDLQDRHLKLTERFFPNAVKQLAIV